MNDLSDTTYELLDAGDGRKLERFAAVVVDRPAPQAVGPKRDPGAWERAHLRWSAEDGWTIASPPPEPWVIEGNGVRYLLAPASGGQVGVFPETFALRRGIAEVIRGRVARGGEAPRVLDLFAFTGGATLVSAKAGAHVVCIDASSAALGAARRNAAANGLEGAPIRWIAEDARTWVAREQKRGSRYEVILLDPPSFGRSGGGRAWTIERDLAPLLAACAALLSDAPLLFQVTAHTEGWDSERLASMLSRAGGPRGGAESAGTLSLRAASGGMLGAGVFARRTYGVNLRADASPERKHAP